MFLKSIPRICQRIQLANTCKLTQTNVASMIFNPCWHNSQLQSANQLWSHSWIFDVSRHDMNLLSTAFQELALAWTLTPETNSMATTRLSLSPSISSYYRRNKMYPPKTTTQISIRTMESRDCGMFLKSTPHICQRIQLANTCTLKLMWHYFLQSSLFSQHITRHIPRQTYTKILQY